MFNSIRKDKNRRILVKKFEVKRLQNKVFLHDRLLTESLAHFLSKKEKSTARTTKDLRDNKTLLDFDSFWSKKTLNSSPRNSSKNRVQNRCIETGRSKAVLRFCKLSRICLRNKASKGNIPGVNKASW